MEENIPVVTESILALGKGGVMVLIILLLAIICGLIYVFYKVTSNHINHGTEAMAKQAESNRSLSDSVGKLGVIIDRKL